MSEPGVIPIRNRAGNIVAQVLVDVRDLEWAQKYSWFLSTSGYAQRSGPRSEGHQTFSMAREIMELQPGDPRQADHINRDKLDNRRSNLRVVSSAENKQNVPARGGSSPHRGVSWHKAKRKWQAFAGINGKLKHLGYFEKELEAAHAAISFRAEHMPFSQESETAV